jgi:hypothetical protein
VVVVILDPLRDWVLRRAEVTVELGGKYKGMTWKSTLRRDYKEGPDGRPLLSRTEGKRTFLKNGQVVHEKSGVTETDTKPRSAIPESEFTLTAFGLPEPHWARPPKRALSLWLWFGIAGIACLVLGAAVFWLKKRRAAGGLQSSP